MFLRFSMVFLTMVLSVVILLIAAQHPTGPNTVSFDDPVGFWISLGMLVAFFVPPLVLSFFNNLTVKVISAIYQSFIVIHFFILIPVGYLIPGVSISVIGTLGALVSIGSIFVTVLVGYKKRD